MPTKAEILEELTELHRNLAGALNQYEHDVRGAAQYPGEDHRKRNAENQLRTVSHYVHRIGVRLREMGQE